MRSNRHRFRKHKPNIKMEFICDKCGAKLEPSESLSNENWQVYNVKEPCKCGGSFKMNIVENATK